MKNVPDGPKELRSEIIIYQTDDGKTQLQVRLENEMVWLTQSMMAALFQTTKQNVGQHLKNIFAESELQQDSVVKKSFTTAKVLESKLKKKKAADNKKKID